MTTQDYIDDQLNLDNPRIFNNSFKKEDYYRIPPVNGSDNVNKAGEINFRCNNKHMLLALFDSLIKVKLDLKGVGDTMNLEHNFFPRMFSSMKLMFGSNEIENLSSVVGEGVTIINFIATPETFRRTYGAISGWIPDDDKEADKTKNQGFKSRISIYEKSPTVVFPLRLIFGFTDYRKVLHQIDNIILSLTRKSDAEIVNEIFFGTAKIKNTGGTADIDPAISFSEIEWWIPSLTPNLEAEAFFEKRLNEKKSFDMTYMKRHSSSVKFSASKYQWTIAGISKQVRYVFLAFKSDTSSNTTNNSLFTAKTIRTLQIRINGQLYPIQSMKINTDDGDISEAYLAYIEACNYFSNEPQLTVTEFRDLYPIFCFNTSAQPELLQSGNECSVTIEKNGNSQIEVFALCLEDARINYNLSNGVVSI